MSLRMNRFGKPLEIGNPNSYKPYINYKWATKIDSLGNRDLIDSGKARLNADLYFGQHMLLNGVDQQITINTVNAVAIYVFRNGVFTTIDVGLVDSYTLSDNATYSNAVSSGFIFSDAQITYFVNTPEKFLYREDNILKSKILTQDEIDNVVAYLPMCENDGYARDLVGYSEGVEKSPSPSVLAADWANDSGESTVADGALRILSTDDSWSSVKSSFNVYEIDDFYAIFEYEIIDNTVIGGGIKLKFNGSAINDYMNTNIGTHKQVVLVESASTGEIIIGRSSTSVDITVSFVSLKKLTSTYPIQNYTSAVRTDAQQLTSGLQTCFLKRDSLGVPYGGSFDALKCDGVGYADTGWVYDIGKDFIIEIVQEATVGIALHGSGDYGDSMLRIGVDSAVRIYCASASMAVGSNPISHVVFKYNSALKIGEGYLSGVKFADIDLTTFTTSIYSFYLGAINGSTTSNFVTEPTLLFKVHTTPQDPLKLYQDAVNKGLLS